MKNVISAVCVECGAEYEATPNTTVCPKCGGILDIKYDYNYIKSHVTPEDMADRHENSMWRYQEFLPVEGIGKRPKLRGHHSIMRFTLKKCSALISSMSKTMVLILQRV